jgi:hypothetical protein
MSGIYTKQFISVLLATTPQSAVVPAGHVWVVRNVQCVSRTGAAGDLVYAMGRGQAIFWFARVGAAQALQQFNVELRYVLAAGETLTLYIGQGQWDVHAAGYDFTV